MDLHKKKSPITIDRQPVADPDAAYVLRKLVPNKRKDISANEARLYLDRDGKPGISIDDYKTIITLYPNLKNDRKFTSKSFFSATHYIDRLSPPAAAYYYTSAPGVIEVKFAKFVSKPFTVENMESTVQKAASPGLSTRFLKWGDQSAIAITGERKEKVRIVDLQNGKVRLELYTDFDSQQAQKTVDVEKIELTRAELILISGETKAQTIPESAKNYLWQFVTN